MTHGNSAINSSPEGRPEGATAGGDQAQTQSILRGHAVGTMGDLKPGEIASRMSPSSTHMFGSEGGGLGPVAMLDSAFKAAAGKAAEATANEASAAPKPTSEEYKRGANALGFGGRKIPIYDYRDTIPSISKTYDPSTGVLKETFPKECGIKDPNKKYGGVVLDKNISQTIAFRGEKEVDGKPAKVIEVNNMSGVHGYGSGLLGATGETPVHSARMWQVQTGTDAKGNPIYESFQEAVVDKVDFKGTKEIDPDTGKPKLEKRRESMLNDDFDRQYADLDPANLAQYAPKTGDEKVVETEPRGDNKNPRPAID